MTSPSPDRFRQADAVFDAALDLQPEQRAAFVERTCVSDSALRSEVHRLLAAHRRSSEFLETPAAELAGAWLGAADTFWPATAAPERIGPFRIERELGHGGMGVVFLAVRDDGEFTQRVALKLIRHASTTPFVVQRFREERRILALLEHPSIARLLDGGITDEGTLWFAMEFVEGESIDQYCDRRRLPIEQRLQLFSALCDAVQVAHQQLVIHRDLKPSNVLVTADGQLKLLDFGIAKLLDPLTADDDLATGGTGPLAMTPEFAAPEQVRGKPTTAATDVYALGVLLFALLTGRRPYDVRGLTAVEVERIVCESEPRRPSETFATATNEQDDSGLRTERARARGATPDRLRHQLAGDLDLVVLKALRKDPRERYGSAQGMALDIRRHLTGHPVIARSLTPGYRMRRFVGRHRMRVAAAMVFALLVIGYGITVTVQRDRVQHALAQATLGAQKAEQVSDFMLGLFKASESGRGFGDTVTVRELLTRGVAQAHEQSAQPEIEAQMLDVIGRLQTQLGKYDEARPILQEALEIRRKALGDEHGDVAASLESLGDAMWKKGEYHEAADFLRRALAIRRQTLGPTHPQTLNDLFELASNVHQGGDNAAAQPLIDEWIAAIAKLPRQVSATRAAQLSDLAAILQRRGDLERAERLHRESLDTYRAVYGERHPSVVGALSNLANTMRENRKLEGAESLERSALALTRAMHPDGHPETANVLRMLGVTLHRARRLEEAEVPFRESLTMYRRFLGEDHLTVGILHEDIALVLLQRGVAVEADPFAREALRVYRGRFPENNLMVKRAGALLGEVLVERGLLEEAEPLLLSGYTELSKRRGLGAGPAKRALRSLVKLYEAQGRADEAARYRALEGR